MRAAIFMLSLLCLCGATATVHAQTGAAPPSIPAPDTGAFIGVRPPGSSTAAVGLSNVQFEPGPAQTPAAEAPVAAPPPDPVLPKWGDYSRPRSVPLALPTLGFDVVGPPRGIIQPDVAEPYRQPLGDPTFLPAIDANLTRAIDLYRPDGIAPAGVRGDHTLKAGHALLSYRYDQSSFDDNFVSSHRVSTASVLSKFQFAPTRLFQDRQTALFEYGVTDDFTLLLTLPFQHSRVDYVDGGGGTFSSGFTNPGDVRISGLYVLYREPGRQLHLNFGMSVPGGFLDSLSDQPSPVVPNLPYVIRTTSGSYDLLPGLTYRGQLEFWTWGAQATGVIHTGLNRGGYEVGDQVDLTTWLSRRVGQYWATSARFDAQGWGNIRRADPRLNTALAPTNRPDMQGGARLNLLFGLNCYVPAKTLPGQIFSIEAGAPVFQALEGPQLGLDWTFLASWNLML
jgi:hypothetical protein